MGFLDILLLPRVWISAIFCLAGMGLLIKAHVRSRLRLIVLSAIFFFFWYSANIAFGLVCLEHGVAPKPCLCYHQAIFVS